MIRINDPRQHNIFDPWDFLTPKRRQLLDCGWPGLFREHILPVLPVHRISAYFNVDFGRPSKELYSMLGALVLQQAFDLTDEECTQQFAFNIQWHYALNITEESDLAKYISAKTLWNFRNIVASNNLVDVIFKDVTKQLAHVFNVDFQKQRIDSVHIKSNMRRLGRIGIFSESIHKFLVNLKRNHLELFNTVEQTIVENYLNTNSEGCFSKVKPSESRKTLDQVSRDLFDLVQQFKTHEKVAGMHSYKLLERVLKEHCNLTEDSNNPIEIKNPKEIPSDSLQNPSDPDASYCGHKGQGYQVQIMETFCDDPENQPDSPNLITHVDVEPAHNSDANALIPAIESAESAGLKPGVVLADSLYGSDENCQQAQQTDVDVIAPTMGTVDKARLNLADFEFSSQGEITACPQGHAPVKTKKKKNISAAFDKEHCQCCPFFPICPITQGAHHNYLHYSAKEARIAMRRKHEQSEEFAERYRWRAGAEATMSEYDRRTGAKRLRVRGLKAVKFCTTLKALAINMFRSAAARLRAKSANPGLCAA